MVNLIRDDDNNKVIGWSLNPSNEEEQEIVGIIRDLQFFGFDDTQMVYDGLKLIDNKLGKSMGNIKSISWIQKKYQHV